MYKSKEEIMRGHKTAEEWAMDWYMNRMIGDLPRIALKYARYRCEHWVNDARLIQAYCVYAQIILGLPVQDKSKKYTKEAYNWFDVLRYTHT